MDEWRRSYLTALGDAVTNHPDTDQALCAMLHSALQYAESWARGVTVDEVRVTVEQVAKDCVRWPEPGMRPTVT